MKIPCGRLALLPLCVVALLWLTVGRLEAAAPVSSSPNVVLIFCDDLGYGDVGCFGAKDIRTPNIDRLAAEGTRFTSFYVAQPVCTASRAGLMTGCYPNRVSLFGALNHESNVGIAADELLAAGDAASLAAMRRPSMANGTWAIATSSCPRGTASTNSSASRIRTTTARCTDRRPGCRRCR